VAAGGVLLNYDIFLRFGLAKWDEIDASHDLSIKQ
jgi:hypothetical protein